MVKIAVLGYGTIGSGVVEALDINKEIIRDHAGEEIEVKYVLDLREFPGSAIESKLVILESGPVGAPSTRPRRDPSRLSRRPLGRLLSAGAPVCGASRASFTTLGSAFRRSGLVREKRAFLF